ncbi:MAG: hypothetical protein M1115_09030 [Actinobacteria bacterium]|nr:hypothetical protein [Actinomycetota bacterium]
MGERTVQVKGRDCPHGLAGGSGSNVLVGSGIDAPEVCMAMLISDLFGRQ